MAPIAVGNGTGVGLGFGKRIADLGVGIASMNEECVEGGEVEARPVGFWRENGGEDGPQ